MHASYEESRDDWFHCDAFVEQLVFNKDGQEAYICQERNEVMKETRSGMFSTIDRTKPSSVSKYVDRRGSKVTKQHTYVETQCDMGADTLVARATMKCMWPHTCGAKR